jgi:hypothetical protein
MLARAMQAGFLQSFAKVFTQVPSIPISTGGSQMQFQSMLTPQSAQAGVAGGVGGAMEKLADYYLVGRIAAFCRGASGGGSRAPVCVVATSLRDG